MNARHFVLTEFTRSLTAALHGYDNTPPFEAVANLDWLCAKFLDPLRERIDSPIIITSGYRCRDLNRAVGGAETSAHLLGLAADFHPSVEELRQEIIEFMADQKVIADEWKHDPEHCPAPMVHWNQFIQYPTFFHVAIAAEGSANRFQMLRYNGFGQGYKKD